MVGSPDASMSVGDWIITMIIAIIPVVGFIAILIWGLSSDTRPEKKNWALAMIVIWVILFVIGIIFFALGINIFSSISQ